LGRQRKEVAGKRCINGTMDKKGERRKNRETKVGITEVPSGRKAYGGNSRQNMKTMKTRRKGGRLERNWDRSRKKEHYCKNGTKQSSESTETSQWLKENRDFGHTTLKKGAGLEQESDVM